MAQFPGHPDLNLDDLSEAAPALRQVASMHRADGRHVTTLPGTVSRRYLNGLLGAPGANRFGVVQLTTHGRSVLDAPDDSPMESQLILARSELDGLDIASWDLDGCVVALTACSSGQRSSTGRSAETSGRQPLAGDEIMGLQAGFFAAGATAVLGTLWPVNIEVASAITLGFHRGLLAGATPDRALHTAVADYRETAGWLKGHPYNWASFFLTSRCRPPAFPSANPDEHEVAR